MTTDAKPKVYAFINGTFGSDDFTVFAIAEDGTLLASHMSSSHGWAKHDIGVTSDWKHDQYAEHYPDGYEVEWVDDPRGHAGLMAAYERNQRMREEAESAA